MDEDPRDNSYDDSLPKVRRPATPAPARPNPADLDGANKENSSSTEDPGGPKQLESAPSEAPSGPPPEREQTAPEKPRRKMRHIPPRSWFVDRLDRNLRTEIDLYYQLAFTTSHEDHESERAVEAHLRAIIGQLSEIARLCGGSGDRYEREHLRVALENALSNALSAVRSVDDEEFGRRASSQDFHGSPWERVLAAWIVIEAESREILDLLETLEPDSRLTIMERLAPSTAPVPDDLEAVALSMRS